MKKEKKGIVYKFLYGKDKVDLKEDNLPKTRKQLFFYLIFNRFRTLALLSLIVSVFFIPLFLWLQLKTVYTYYGEISIPVNLEMTEEAYLLIRKFSINIIAYLVAIPLIMLASVGCSGAFYVSRRLVWGEGIIIKNDFLIGIKKSWKQYLIMGFIFAISLMILMVNTSFYQLKIDLNVITRTSFLFFSIVQFLIILSVSMFVFTQAAIYDQPIKNALKNGFLFSFIKLPKNIFIIFISTLLIMLLAFASNVVIELLVYFVLSVFGFAWAILIWTLYTHSIFDKYLNQVFCPDLVNKGIYTK